MCISVSYSEFSSLTLFFLTVEWEAAKNAPEPVKEVVSQAVSAEPMAATNTQQTQQKAFIKQVSMMPVQVPKHLILN